MLNAIDTEIPCLLSNAVKEASDNESNEVAATEPTADVDLSESMAAYTAAISKTKAKKLY